MRSPRYAIAAIALLGVLAAHLRGARAASTPDFLLSDREFTHAEAMSLADVHAFLQQRSSPLATAFLPDAEGLLKFPFEIIWLASIEARINPKVLLTTLQKEQGLVTDPQPSPRQLDFAMGYGCPDGSGCSERFRGFGKQIRGAALQFRGYLDDLAMKGETIAAWAVGRARQSGDGFTITPRNAATAALYSYTPWRGGGNGNRIGGNLSFSRIWTEWFGGGIWPDGTVLEDPERRRWLLEDGKRRLLATPAVVAIRSARAAIVAVRREELETYTAATSIKFVDFAVVVDPDGVRWLLVGNARRKIPAEAFRRIGFHPEEVEPIAAADLTAYREGHPVTAAGGNPRGLLVRERGTNRTYHVVEGVQRLVPDSLIQRLLFADTTPVLRTPAELRSIKTGEPYRFPDGVIVTAPKSLPRVFIISHGERRPFTSPRSLETLGYQWADVRHVTDAALELHPLGAPLDEEPEATVAEHTPAPSPAVPSRPRYISGLSIF